MVSSLVKLLVPPLPAEPLIAHMRIVDKFSIYPPTTFISKATLKTLQDRKGLIEYRQANLQNQGKVWSMKGRLSPTKHGLHQVSCPKHSLTQLRMANPTFTWWMALGISTPDGPLKSTSRIPLMSRSTLPVRHTNIGMKLQEPSKRIYG